MCWFPKLHNENHYVVLNVQFGQLLYFTSIPVKQPDEGR